MIMELVKGLLKTLRELIERGERARKVDEKVYSEIENAAGRIATALVYLRMRGKLDPKSEKELETILTSR